LRDRRSAPAARWRSSEFNPMALVPAQPRARLRRSASVNAVIKSDLSGDLSRRWKRIARSNLSSASQALKALESNTDRMISLTCWLPLLQNR